MARGQSTDHARSQAKARKLKCYYCHKEGHYRKDCTERKEKKKDNSKTADSGLVKDNSDGVNFLSVTISSSDGEWILNTGCSYHICPKRDWFATYHSFDGGVLMGNDVACKVGSTVTGVAAAAALSSDATLQTIVALSTTEAEYIAATEAVKEAIWLKGLVGDLRLKHESSTVYCDSQRAIHFIKN
ncbi:hypothetical protein RJ639_000149 [Escallonia herrerae]|uniref:CCHC-type domain-containing protein n=1 Tax=Escallonia herrerae TaxID=1293975 RepID=A0AA88XQ60_9ASTE|nr:hypothetical protein RJ639_000149 [Escallonia herrerae]